MVCLANCQKADGVGLAILVPCPMRYEIKKVEKHCFKKSLNPLFQLDDAQLFWLSSSLDYTVWSLGKAWFYLCALNSATFLKALQT